MPPVKFGIKWLDDYISNVQDPRVKRGLTLAFQDLLLGDTLLCTEIRNDLTEDPASRNYCTLVADGNNLCIAGLSQNKTGQSIHEFTPEQTLARLPDTGVKAPDKAVLTEDIGRSETKTVAILVVTQSASFQSRDDFWHNPSLTFEEAVSAMRFTLEKHIPTLPKN